MCNFKDSICQMLEFIEAHLVPMAEIKRQEESLAHFQSAQTHALQQYRLKKRDELSN